MKASTTEDCIACRRRVEICLEVLEIGEEIAEVRVDETPGEYQDATQEAADECPTSAILAEK